MNREIPNWDTDDKGNCLIPCKGGCGRINITPPTVRFPADNSRKAWVKGVYQGEWLTKPHPFLKGWTCAGCATIPGFAASNKV